MDLTPGMIVRVSRFSQKSFLLYKSMKKKFPMITCACRWKNSILAVVDSIYENGIIILTQKDNPNVIGVCYYTDIESVYEVNINIER